MILRTAASDDFPTTLAACHGMRAYTRPIQCMDDEKTVKNNLQDGGEEPIIAMTPFDEFRLSEAIGDQLMKSPCNSGSHAAVDGPSSSVYSPAARPRFLLVASLVSACWNRPCGSDTLPRLSVKCLHSDSSTLSTFLKKCEVLLLSNNEGSALGSRLEVELTSLASKRTARLPLNLPNLSVDAFDPKLPERTSGPGASITYAPSPQLLKRRRVSREGGVVVILPDQQEDMLVSSAPLAQDDEPAQDKLLEQRLTNRMIPLVQQLAASGAICGTTDLSLLDARVLTSWSLDSPDAPAASPAEDKRSILGQLLSQLGAGECLKFMKTISVHASSVEVDGGHVARRPLTIELSCEASSTGQAHEHCWHSEARIIAHMPRSASSRERGSRRSEDAEPSLAASIRTIARLLFEGAEHTLEPAPTCPTGSKDKVDLSCVPLTGILVAEDAPDVGCDAGKRRSFELRPLIPPSCSPSCESCVLPVSSLPSNQKWSGIFCVSIWRRTVDDDWGIRLFCDQQRLAQQKEPTEHITLPLDELLASEEAQDERRGTSSISDLQHEEDQKKCEVKPTMATVSRRRGGVRVSIRRDSLAGRQIADQCFATPVNPSINESLALHFSHSSSQNSEQPHTVKSFANNSMTIAAMVSRVDQEEEHDWFDIEAMDFCPVSPSSAPFVKKKLGTMLRGTFHLRQASGPSGISTSPRSETPLANKVLEGVWKKITPTEKWGVKFHDGTLLVAGCADNTPCGRTPPPAGSLLSTVNNVEVATFAEVVAALQGKDEVRVRFLVPCRVLLQKSAADEPLGFGFPSDHALKPKLQQVLKGSPAGRSGIPPSSTIVSIDGKLVRDVKMALATVTGLKERLVSTGVVVEFLSPVTDLDNIEALPSVALPPAQVKDAAPPLASTVSALAPESTTISPRPFSEVRLQIDKSVLGKDATLGITFHRTTGEIKTVNTHGLIYKSLEKHMASSNNSSSAGSSTGGGVAAGMAPPPGQWLVGMFMTHVGETRISYDGSEAGKGIAQLISQAGSAYSLQLSHQPLQQQPAAPPAEHARTSKIAPDALFVSQGPAAGSQQRTAGYSSSGRLFAGAQQPTYPRQQAAGALMQPSGVPTIEFLLAEALSTMSDAAQQAASFRFSDWKSALHSELIFDAKDLIAVPSDTAATRPAQPSTPAESKNGEAAASSATGSVLLAPLTGVERLLKIGIPPTVIERMCPFGNDSLHCFGWTQRCITNISITEKKKTKNTIGETFNDELVGGGHGTLLLLPCDILGEDGTTVVGRKGSVVIATTACALKNWLACASSGVEGSTLGEGPYVALTISRLGHRRAMLTVTSERPASPSSNPSEATSASATESASAVSPPQQSTSQDLKTTASSSSIGSQYALTILQADVGGGAPSLANELVLLVPSSGTSASDGLEASRAVLKYGANPCKELTGDAFSSVVGFSPFGGRVRYLPPLGQGEGTQFVREGILELDAGAGRQSASTTDGKGETFAAEEEVEDNLRPLQLFRGSPILFQSNVAGIVLDAYVDRTSSTKKASGSAAPPTPPPPSGKKDKKAAVNSVDAGTAPVAAVVEGGKNKISFFPTAAFSHTRFKQVMRTAAIKFR